LSFGVEAAPKRLSEAERTLIGQHVDSLDIKPVAAAASALDAMEDVHVTADYRRHLAGVLIRRALNEACTTMRRLS
jgi:aerobic carbon-monoxide dehydrogenase medium subunit